MRSSWIELYQAAVKRDDTASIMRISWIQLYQAAIRRDNAASIMRISWVTLYQAAAKRDNTASIMRTSWVEVYQPAVKRDDTASIMRISWVKLYQAAVKRDDTVNIMRISWVINKSVATSQVAHSKRMVPWNMKLPQPTTNLGRSWAHFRGLGPMLRLRELGVRGYLFRDLGLMVRDSGFRVPGFSSGVALSFSDQRTATATRSNVSSPRKTFSGLVGNITSRLLMRLC